MVVDLASVPALTGRAGWAVDRVHLSTFGHEAVARAAARALGARAVPEIESSVVPSSAAHLRWVATCGLGWFAAGGAVRSAALLAGSGGG